jgi:predicted deacylase
MAICFDNFMLVLYERIIYIKQTFSTMFIIKRKDFFRQGNLVIFFFLLVLTSCKSVKLQTFEFPKPVDTNSKEIAYQEKKIYNLSDLYFADNQFDGARLNNFELVNDSTLVATILPENEPINSSPHYAFRLWSSAPAEVYLQLNYPTNKHRYWPKLSNDGTHWKPIDSVNFKVLTDSSKAQLKLNITNDKLWIAAQELNNSTHVTNWAKERANHTNVHFNIVGKSKLGRDLIMLDIYVGSPEGKDMVVIFSRQHPPEVSGYMAMQAFVDELLKDNRLSKDFIKKYRILVFPLLNPDGVDLGHWRHNAGGIDLNRDWAYYRQEEPKNVANYIVNTVKKSKNTVVLGLDFHSTQEDLYYSLSDDNHSVIYPFKDYWIKGIDDALPNYTPADYPEPFNQPITKAWFFKQFGADSVTYEIGDETPRDFIKLKAEVAAREMMKLLILR